ncbi:pirin family protein [Chitinophagaceae bacterium LB-8]|jgi:quercetin 2,3-dioxygenase|uniref:Pirin family protein n=1 Tax=Paraflavisolibacter caeni TaxID=2982496 RepID=A0A9X2XWB1_9BACT|nr:pirin-like C-terminal cupin domain-containing protein [Paraflavisolibacter caeni]MCU7549677.1 pirin family protein [Paraflavisolibacter caeni]
MIRKLTKIHTPPGEPGFLGPGHTARPVIQIPFSESDPFIMLMDDILDKKDEEPVGGPHPHAGFETVSLLLEGEMGEMKGGDFQIMTAGSGIVHTETIDKKARMRLLQLWLNLPKKDRWAMPRVQDLPFEHVPKLSQNGVHIKLYSGSLAGMTSPIKNYVPMIVADISFEPGVATVQKIPANYNTFLYVLNGSVEVGDEGRLLKQDQVGWLDLPGNAVPSELRLRAGEEGVRFVLYAGQPQGDPIVSYGPFIGDSSEDIKRLYQDYRQGKMGHIADVGEGQRFLW